MWGVESEYARHFIGPDSLIALPWESPYLSHETSLFQGNTLAVRAAYAEKGLAPKKLRQVPDDHVSLMCCFMVHEGRGALEAFRAGDESAFRDSVLSQGAFVHAHLVSWLGEFARQSCTVRATRKSTAFLYPQMAKVAAEFARLDEEFLAEAIAWIEEGGMGPDRPRCSDEVRSACFGPVEDAQKALWGLRLFGLEDNELEPIAQEKR